MGKRAKKPRLRIDQDHHLEVTDHRTAVRKASGRCFIAKCSCGWQGFRKWAVQTEATKDAIRHQQTVRQAATQRERASTIASHPLATVSGSGMASAARSRQAERAGTG